MSTNNKLSLINLLEKLEEHKKTINTIKQTQKDKVEVIYWEWMSEDINKAIKTIKNKIDGTAV